ncbi:hypothetical protein BSLG_005535 [Batrachochytrium salamandrivorans]|nr:hypothetical protein BSLG_005535 [Batrachochytrium salamandrivorans]
MPLLSRSPSVQHIQTGASPTEEAVWERYRKGDQVGRGVYGIVYRAVDASSGSVVAVKRTPGREGVGSTTLREACILSRDNHRTNPSSKARRQSRHRKTVGAENVVQLKCALYSNTSHRHLFFIMDYAETDLAKHMKVHRRELGIQVDELSYTPTRDLQQMQQVQQPSNILINSRPGDPTSGCKLKLLISGLLAFDCSQTGVITLPRAPEVFFGLREYGSAVDIWSCGCIFAELARGQPLFDGESEIGLLQDIQRKLGVISPGDVDGTKHSVLPFSKKVSITPLNNLVPLSSPGIDLLKSMLAHKSSTRTISAGIAPFLL